MPDIKNNPVFSHPLDYGIKVWRYMDFTKFVAMLQNNGLFFARSDLLGDPFEGSYPIANKSQFAKIYKRDMEMFAGQDIQKRDGFEKTVDGTHQSVKGLRDKILINCWHMNEHESAAMWKLYGEGDKAVCIQSIYRKLRDALPQGVGVGAVTYIDFEKEPIPEGTVLANFMHKRKSFEHEREVRALRWLSTEVAPPQVGQWESVNLQDLIEHVFVAPQAPDWFAELVENVLNRYEFKVPVKKSDMSKSPFW